MKKENKTVVWNKGLKMSQESRLKMSLAKKGKPSNRKGKKHTPNTIEKMRHAKLGKKASYETRLKMSKIRKGCLSYGWKGGITKESSLIRGSFEYGLWRKSCFERDNFICQKTKISGGDLEVHHINNFSDFPELRFAIDNGVTLSKKSHKEFHKKYSNRNNTMEQLQEFLKN